MTKHARAKNLTDGSIADIVAILDGWSTQLSWDLLIEKVEQRLRLRYTRQALHKHERIRLAFATRKKRLSKGGGTGPQSTGNPELDKTLERLDRLKEENHRLELENSALLEQFARWAYNASTRNLSSDFLNQPLPTVDRGQTKRAKRR